MALDLTLRLFIVMLIFQSFEREGQRLAIVHLPLVTNGSLLLDVAFESFWAHVSVSYFVEMPHSLIFTDSSV